MGRASTTKDTKSTKVAGRAGPPDPPPPQECYGKSFHHEGHEEHEGGR